MTNFISAALVEPNWASRLGASCLPSVSFLGTGAPAAGPSTALLVTAGPATAGLAKAGSPALPRLRDKVAVMVPQAQQLGAEALVGQTNIHNYMTDIFTVGEGASGPPRDRGPV